MKRFFHLIIIATLVSVAWHSGSSAQSQTPPRLYQVSNITALKEGRYSGLTTVGGLKKHGDFGLGTLEGLDGEMIALDSEYYQVKVSGEVRKLEDGERVPFAIVTFFKPGNNNSAIPVEAPTFDDLKKRLDAMAPLDSHIYAFQVKGLFKIMKARSVPCQQKPYPKLSEVIKRQRIFNYEDVSGTMVGFRFPTYMKGVNVPDYHFHFIGSNGELGGHVLECSPGKAVVSWSKMEGFVMEGFPEAGL